MRRYWVPKESLVADEVVLTGDVLHHVRDVCRMGPGARFEVLVEGGQAHLVEMLEVTKKQATARVLETRVIEALPKPHIHVAISIPRFAVFEAVIEKAVELGVYKIHPFFSDFSFIRTQSDVVEHKKARWRKIVQSATQQSGRGDLMEIAEAVPLEKLLDELNRQDAATGLFAYEGESPLDIKGAVAQMRSGSPQSVFIFVGSEGGFSDREVEVFKCLGLSPVTLGHQVLRVETACVALISVIKYDFDQMR